jgi:hypothetical protein
MATITTQILHAKLNRANNMMRSNAARDAQRAMPLILFFNKYLFLNHQNNTVGRVMV